MRNEVPIRLANAVVMLSEALQRNPKHEARLSNIVWLLLDSEKNQRFFASLTGQ